MRKVTVAVVQSPGEPGADHLELLAGLIGDAAQQGAQLVLLPELFAMPYHFESAAWAWATPRKGAIEMFLQATAKKAGVFLGGTYLEACGSDFFNTFALAGPGGELVGRVGKAHPCSFERWLFAPSPGPQVIACVLGRVGVAICYDNALRAIADRLLAERPDLWLMPMSAPMPPFSLAGKAGIARYRRELALADEAVGMCCAAVVLDPARQRLLVPPEFDCNRPWVTPPLLDYRLFPLHEWWGRRYYQRHPQRALMAQQRGTKLDLA